MSPQVRRRLEALRDRHHEVALLLSQPEVHDTPDAFQRLSREYAQLDAVDQGLARYERLEREQTAARSMFEQEQGELRDMARAELQDIEAQLAGCEEQLLFELLPRDPDDDHNIFLEIRAGTGGDEAALFAGDLFRMYARYAETRGWRLEVLSQNPGEKGGFKEIIARLEGESVYQRMKYEAGTHRVQRVPETEAQGRIHTSACTVAVLPEQADVDAIEINPAELKIDTFRASGAGGQHVNKTDSAIRITHLPTGTVVECQDERSQHKNRARALGLLQARLQDAERAKASAQQAESRRLQVGSGDRSQRIRTYNYPQGRLTDHRINLTLYQLEEILEGDLDPVIEPLLREQRAGQLQDLLGSD